MGRLFPKGTVTRVIDGGVGVTKVHDDRALSGEHTFFLAGAVPVLFVGGSEASTGGVADAGVAFAFLETCDLMAHAPNC